MTRETFFDIPLNELLNSARTNIVKEHWWSLYFIRATIYALDRNAFNYAAFQYLNIGKEKFVGQQVILPDIGNIKNGKGILGSAVSRTIFKRFTDWRGNPTRIDSDPYAGDPTIQPPTVQAEKTKSASGDSLLNISWSKVQNMPWYMIALRHQYLWFSASQTLLLTRQLSIDIPYTDLTLRDARIEILVRGLDFVSEDGDSIESIIDAPPFNSSCVVNGQISVYTFWESSHEEIIKLGGFLAQRLNQTTQWSKPFFVHTADGD